MSELRLIDADNLVNKLAAFARNLKRKKKTSVGVRYKQLDITQYVIQSIIKYINNGTFPVLEAEPVRHGKLVYKGRLLDCEYFNCSECETELSIVGNKPNYCPHCGARMDGDVT